MSARDKKILTRIRKVCLALPGTTEALSWGHPTFRVANKIFATFSPGHGGLHIAFKARSREVLQRPRVVSTPWSKHGWVMRMIGEEETAEALGWDEIDRWLLESYELVAPKPRATKLPKKKAPARKSSKR